MTQKYLHNARIIIICPAAHIFPRGRSPKITHTAGSKTKETAWILSTPLRLVETKKRGCFWQKPSENPSNL